MNYAIASDIASEFKSIDFDETTAITSTEVEGFITQASQEINAIIGARYKAPISADEFPEANALLKAICISIVADRVSGIMRLRTGNSKADQNSKTGVNAVWGREMLRQIRKGEALLIDENGAEVSRAGGVSSISSFNVDSGVENNFDLDKDQW